MPNNDIKIGCYFSEVQPRTHNHVRLQGERCVLELPMKRPELIQLINEGTLVRVDDIAKRHLGDGVALFCIINEHSRLNNTYTALER